MELSTRYNPKETEEKWYSHWMAKGYFHSVPDEREPYSIVIPPPNVTGVLHMGHMLNNTIQDILIRKARLEGKNACWVPGTDHASIATEAKVVNMLREQGVKKSDLSRQEFLKYAWQWTDKYGGIILDQLKKLGASCDWDRTRFTMEPKLYHAVIKVFVDLYGKGKIYRGLRMTNWDPAAQTALSNEEVIYKEEQSQLFHIKYFVEGDPERFITIATQRPETIMADTAVAVHPDDERFTDLIGKMVLIPLIHKAIPIIADAYVDPGFGTGALKITPAHDQNDYEVGQRHHLPVIDIFTPQGTLNDNAQILIGEDRFVARKKIKKLLEEAGNLDKIEDYTTKIGRSERTDAVVEPRLTMQWFLSMKEMAATALEAVRSGEVKFYPEHFWNMYFSWLNEENVRDWCISRQLWWGQQIPAWYYQDKIFVAETADEALEWAKKELGNPNLTLSDLRQDEDVVDTWFSSWLWPLTVFDGFENPEELKYYYPTNALVTGWDIMFFWVARMIMSGYEWSGDLLGEDWVKQKGRQPFREVYFTGMVRDSKRRKMSKSLGNSPDALQLIENYGADGVRFGMLSSAAAGNDIIFDAPIDLQTKTVKNESKLCEQGRNFCNKLWNALRLIKGWEISREEPNAIDLMAHQWIQDKLNALLSKMQQDYVDYKLSEILMDLYKFIWDDFCSWYLEMIKPEFGKPLPATTLENTLSVFEELMILLHPYMPFITEEVWQNLRDRLEGEDCIVAAFPKPQPYDTTLIDAMQWATASVTGIRDIRNAKGLSPKEALKVFLQATTQAKKFLDVPGIKDMIIKMANLSEFHLTSSEVENAVSFLSGAEKFYVVLNQTIDVAAEKERLSKELEYYKGFIESVAKKLGNEKFVAGAPAQVVEMERKKLADGESKLRSLHEALDQLER